LVLLALVAVPFLPEAIILMIAAAARIGGCKIENACAAGPWAAETVRLATEVGVSIGVAFGVGLVIVWLAGCYAAITLGWDSLPRRLLLALAVTLVFAFLPYFSPGFVLDPFVNAKCTPNEGGAGGCEIYDGQKVGGVVHETATLPGFLLIAVPLTITAFALYVIVVIILRVRSRRRGAPAKAV
jgi:hypothetical protein